MARKEYVRSMFDRIAGDYDRLNHIMSLDVDRSWRRKAVRAALEASPGEENRTPEVLDVACGTGDFSIALARAGARVTGIDLSQGMLDVMAGKVEEAGLSGQITQCQGDCEALPFEDGSFDCVTVAFGVRNFEHLEKGLQEMRRGLRPGGRFVVLEPSLPENPLIRWAFNLYFMHILPWIGGKVSGDKAAYRYLPASVARFPGRKAFQQILRDAGYGAVRHRAFSLGVCRLYTAVNP